MDVSYTVVCWNKAQDIGEVVARYLTEADTYRFDCEVIVVDQGSTDGSRDAVAAIGDPRIRLIANATNVGVGAARNQMLPLCRGRFIFIGDDDIYIVPGSVRAMMAYLDGHPEYAALSPNAWFTTMHGNPATAKCETIQSVRIGGNYLWAYALVRREVFAQLRWPDYRPFDGPGWGYDETELVHRMRELGFEYGVTLDFFYRHDGSDGRRTTADRARIDEKKSYLRARWPGVDFNPTYEAPARRRRRVAVMRTPFEHSCAGPVWKLGQFWKEAAQEVCDAVDFRFGAEVPGYDVYLYVDDGMPFPYRPPAFARPSMLYVSETFDLRDSPLTAYTARRASAAHFDHVFLAQFNAWRDFADAPAAARVTWLPHAASDRHVRARPAPDALEWDVAFVGHLTPDRVPYVERCIAEGFRVFHGWRDGPDYPDTVARARIGFNLGRGGSDLNMRVFETMAAGAMLLTNAGQKANGLDQLFTDGRHYVAYADQEDMVAKIRHYLAAHDERETIAAAGHRAVLGAHLYYHRFLTLMDSVTAP